MKNYILYIIFFVTSSNVFAQIITHADAFESTVNDYCKCVTITPSENYKAGSFWSETPLNLSESFELVVKPRFG